MPWANTPADRARSAATYSDPEYKRNRAAAWKRAGGCCEWMDAGRRCGSRDRCQVDHIRPVSEGGTHHQDNLRVLCTPHHGQKTAREGGGWRKKAAPDPPVQQRTQW